MGVNLNLTGDLNANAFNPGFTTTATTSFGQLVLTNTSTQLQVFTGSATGYSVKLPVESTMANGANFTICNTSSADIVIYSSGLGQIIILQAGLQATVYLVNNSVTTAAAWNVISNNPPTIFTSGNITNPYLTFGGSAAGITYNAANGSWVTMTNNGISKTFFTINIAILTYSGVTAGDMALTNLSSLPNMPVNSIFVVGGINAITYTGQLIAKASASGTIVLQSQISSASSGSNLTTLTDTNFNSASIFYLNGWF